MKLSLDIQDSSGNAGKTHRQYPPGFKTRFSLEESRISGSIPFAESYFEGVHLAEFSLTAGKKLEMSWHCEMLMGFFTLDQSVHLEDLQRPGIINVHSGLFGYFPQRKFRFISPLQARICVISILPEYFERLADSTDPIMAEILDAMAFENEIIYNWRENGQMEINSLIRQLSKPKYCGAAKRFHLESKILEVLLKIIEQQWQTSANPSSRLDKPTQDCLFQARHLIIENMQRPPTIPELAKACGLNEYSLKKNYKIFFRQTIFESITEMRMEKARQLLTDTELPINEIAETVGYTYTQHFSKAFKRKYDILPSAWRNLNRE